MRSAIQRSRGEELSAFGWWFTSSVFDTDWSLQTLDQVLAATNGDIEWEQEVAKKLATLVDGAPDKVKACIAKFIDGGRPGRVAWCGESVRRILSRLRGGPEDAGAREIASRLVARGWPDDLVVRRPPRRRLGTPPSSSLCTSRRRGSRVRSARPQRTSRTSLEPQQGAHGRRAARPSDRASQIRATSPSTASSPCP
jgi:hypothetical protein